MKSNLFIPTLFTNPENTAAMTTLPNAITVGLFDANTNEYLSCAKATAAKGELSFSLRTGCDDAGENAGEDQPLQAGVFEVDVQREGYLPWQTKHRVGATVLNIYLTPL